MSDYKKDPLDLLRKKQPSDLQMHRWKVAVKSQFPVSSNWLSLGHLFQLMTAMGVGVVVGALIFGNKIQDQPLENLQNAYDDATLEVVYTKLD
jgi:hypothetical protein